MSWFKSFKRLPKTAPARVTRNVRLAVTALEDRLALSTYATSGASDQVVIGVDGSSPTGISVKINSRTYYPDTNITINATEGGRIVIGDFYGYTTTRVNIVGDSEFPNVNLTHSGQSFGAVWDWQFTGDGQGTLGPQVTFSRVFSVVGSPQGDRFDFQSGGKVASLDGRGGPSAALDFSNRTDNLNVTMRIYGSTGSRECEVSNVTRSVGIATVFGGRGNDKFTGSVATDLFGGGPGNDTIQGGGGDDLIYGGSGNDWLYAEGGNDVVVGEAGHDWVSGGDGHDLLVGGTGTDVLYAGAGNDICIFGTTAYDADPYRLWLAEAAWVARQELTHAQRVAELSAGVTIGGVTVRLNSSTVFGDNTEDAYILFNPVIDGYFPGTDWLLGRDLSTL